PGVRQEIGRVLLDEMRRVLAVDAHALTTEFVDRLHREGRDQLSGLWAISDSEREPSIGITVAGPGGRYRPRNVQNLTGRGAFGRWLRQRERFHADVSVSDADDIIAALMTFFDAQGLVSRVSD